MTENGSLGAVCAHWWHRMFGGDDGPARTARARLRRCTTASEALTIDAVHDLNAGLRAKGFRPDADRLALIAIALAHVAEAGDLGLAAEFGRRAAIDAIGREINTTITVRDYRTDVAVAVAVWSRDGRWSLERVAAALRRPMFVLFLGRKSCPLAAPVHPRIVEAPDPVAALRDYAAPGWLRRVAPGAIRSDPFPGGTPDRVEQAPVEPLDRTTVWHFGQGDVWHFEREAGS